MLPAAAGFKLRNLLLSLYPRLVGSPSLLPEFRMIGASKACKSIDKKLYNLSTITRQFRQDRPRLTRRSYIVHLSEQASSKQEGNDLLIALTGGLLIAARVLIRARRPLSPLLYRLPI